MATGQGAVANSSVAQLDAYLEAHPECQLRVACPSQEFSALEMAQGTGRWFSGVRGLWESLSLATERQLAMIMVQAPPVDSIILDYLFGLAAAARHTRRELASRHALVNLDDSGERHLSAKLLDRNDVLDQLKLLIARTKQRGQVVQGLSGYASSERMAALAAALGVELLDTPPQTLVWGTKANSRTIFRRTAIGHRVGTYEPQRSLPGLATCSAPTSKRSDRSRTS